MIPAFPEFKTIDIEDREGFNAVVRAHPPLCSEYTFTNIFGWGAAHDYALSSYGRGLVIRRAQHGRLSFLQPLVGEGHAAAVRACLEMPEGESPGPVLERVGEDFIGHSSWKADGLVVAEDRDNFDYLYSVRDLVELGGKKYHAKKNLVTQFEKAHAYRYLPLTAGLVDRCLQFEHEWCEERECETIEGLSHERCAIIRMLENLERLEVHGGVIEVDGRIAALTLGERLNADTLVIHVEKARSDLVGLYQTINRDFLRHEGRDFTYVNREQDLGVEGLRKAKLSYHPVRMVRKYTIAPGR